MKKVVILGSGAMGTAFSIPAFDAGNNVSIVGTQYDDAVIEKLLNDRIHPALGIEIKDGIEFYKSNHMNQLLSNHVDVIVVGVNSRGIDWVVEKLNGVIGDGTIILMLTKGLRIENDSIVLFSHYMTDAVHTINGNKSKVAAIAGPCLAGGLALRKDHNIVVAHENEKVCESLEYIFSTKYYHLEKNTDVIGVEACSALKNVFALGVASVNGKASDSSSEISEEMKKNQTAVVFSQALKEMSIIVQWLGGNKETVYGLSGLGDLYTTSLGGRNGKLGLLLGSGVSYKDAIENELKGITVEGADATLLLGPIIKNAIVSNNLERSKLPLFESIINTICNDAPLELTWKDYV